MVRLSQQTHMHHPLHHHPLQMANLKYAIQVGKSVPVFNLIEIKRITWIFFLLHIYKSQVHYLVIGLSFCFFYKIESLDQNCYAVGSTARASGPSATAGQNPTSVHLYRQTIQFSVNAWVEYSFPSYAFMCNTWRIDFVKCATHFYLFMDYNFLSFHFYCLLSSFARNGKLQNFICTLCLLFWVLYCILCSLHVR